MQDTWNSQFDEQPVRITDYLRILYRGRWIIVFSFISVFAATAYFSFTTPPIYESSCKVIVVQSGGLERTLFSVSPFGQQMTRLNNQLQILKSRYLAIKVVDYLSNSTEYDSLLAANYNLSGEEAIPNKPGIGQIMRSMDVSIIRDTDIIQIKMKASSGWEAAYLANSVAEVYKELDQTTNRQEITQVVDFLDDQLEKIEKELKYSEEAFKEFQQESGSVSLTGDAALIVNQLVTFESAYREAQIEISTNSTRLAGLKSRLGELKQSLVADLADITHPKIIEYRSRIASIEANLATYKIQGVPDNFPQVEKEKKNLEGLKKSLADETKKLLLAKIPVGDPLQRNQGLVEAIITSEIEISAFGARAAALKTIVDDFDSKLEELPEKTLQLARLERSRRLNENIYLMMKEKYEETRITRAGQIGKIRMVDGAVPSGNPISPKTNRNLLLGALIGLGLGIGITFLIEYMDNSIRTIENVERLKLPLLGSIPEIKPELTNGKWKPLFIKQFQSKNDKKVEEGKIAERLITHLKPKSHISEAYRALRTQLQYSKTDDPARTILVSSPGPGEGKSTSVANLAIALAQMGSKVILVDTDLRRPVLHNLFNLSREVGLTNYLVGNEPLTSIVKVTEIENLHMITTGILPPNPSEMIGSKRMREFLQEIKQEFEYVLFDSPPMIAVTDALVLAPLVDGVVVVLRSGKTDRDAALRTFELLQNVRGRALGVLLNDVSASNMYGSYYYYYYYYYYYGDSGEKKSRKGGKHRRKHRKQSHKADV